MRILSIMACLVMACGCTSATLTDVAVEDTERLVTTVPVSVTTTLYPRTTSATVASSTTVPPPSIPPVPEPGELLPEPVALVSYSDGFVVAALSANVLLVMEPTDRRFAGCESDTDAAWRFFRQNLSSGREATLFEQTDDERWFPQVHHSGRVALLTGCDANGWLEGVGLLDSNGNFTKTLRGDKEVRYGNNAPRSVAWTADGETLFLNQWQIDARTADIVTRPAFADTSAAVRAVLADGSAVTETRTGGHLRFELMAGDGGRTLEVAEGAGWNLPVEVGGNGANVLIRFSEFGEVEGALSVVFGAAGRVELAGLAWFSPSGERLLVQRDETRWDLTDLNGVVAQTLELSTPRAEVGWTHDETGLVVQTSRSDPESPREVWFVAVPAVS